MNKKRKFPEERTCKGSRNVYDLLIIGGRPAGLIPIEKDNMGDTVPMQH